MSTSPAWARSMPRYRSPMSCSSAGTRNSATPQSRRRDHFLCRWVAGLVSADSYSQGLGPFGARLAAVAADNALYRLWFVSLSFVASHPAPRTSRSRRYSNCLYRFKPSLLFSHSVLHKLMTPEMFSEVSRRRQ